MLCFYTYKHTKLVDDSRLFLMGSRLVRWVLDYGDEESGAMLEIYDVEVSVSGLQIYNVKEADIELWTYNVKLMYNVKY